MPSILFSSAYQVTEAIYETPSTVVYRGYRFVDRLPVVIKLLRSEYPTLKELSRLRHEYSILQSLAIAGVAKPYELIEQGHQLALILEDCGGQSLKQVLAQGPIDLLMFLPIAIQIADTLAALHAQQIIHKDIKPHNIVFNAKTQQVKLIDFSIASQWREEASSPAALEGTLSYISPEQTGRTNRRIDCRSDLYSLGITFYELLAGRLPFEATDPMELVHSHIARIPVPLHEVAATVPLVVSQMVMKLLAKNAEDRYQTAYGLKADLERCLRDWNQGTVPLFAIAQTDQPGPFQLPTKLYGREAEVACLLEAFQRSCDGAAQLLLIDGYSGIGKSALVHQVYQPIMQQRGHFVTGKFDQLKRDLPYSALVQAVQQLIRQLLTKSEPEIGRWRDRLTTALGVNGQVMIDVIPEVELLIGPQAAVAPVDAAASQNRFHLMFRQFIHSFATADQPLVVFLDDLHWADRASLSLIQLLLTDASSRHLLILGAYRGKEISATHPLLQLVAAIEQTHAPVQRLSLHNLTAADVEQLITDTLNGDRDMAQSLTELLLPKTQGNPLFLTQLLKSLYDDQLLRFDGQTGRWRCDLQQIQQHAFSDSILDFMIGKLQKLPASTQEALKLAACVGNRFDLLTLATVGETSGETMALELWAAIEDGLIVATGEAPLPQPQPTPLLPAVAMNYRFLHDRVQQAAYALIPDDRKQATHLKIGRLLLQNATPDTLEEKLFEIVNALNNGAGLISDRAEQQELALLNLRAGQKAKLATAYEPALNYLTIGMALLGASGWQDQYAVALTLHTEAAEAAYLATDFERAAQLVAVIEQQAANRLDRVKAYELKIQLHMAQLRMLDAVNTGLHALQLLNIPLISASAVEPIELPALARLAEAPEMTDPADLAVLHLLRTVTSPAYQAQPDVFKSLVLTQVNFCIQRGHSAAAAFAYAAYGWLMCGRVGNLEVGYQAGQIALALLRQAQDQEQAKLLRCSVLQLFETFIRPWKEHLRATFAPFLDTIQIGRETGAIEYASYCVINYCTHLFLAAEPLDSLDQTQVHYIELQQEFKQEFQTAYTQLLRQLTLNLRQPDAQRQRLIGECFDETQMLPHFEAANNHQALFATYTAKLILAYLFKDYAEAVAAARMAATYADSGAGLALSGAHCFYYALALVQEQGQPDPVLLELHQRLQAWAEAAPMNYYHKLMLVQAELARVQGQTLEAMDAYDQAIQAAQAQRYLQEEAIASERAAEFYWACGRERIAQTYLMDAYDAYERWGATAKLRDLEQQYALKLPAIASRSSSAALSRSAHPSTSTSATNSTGALDLLTVIKASQALSGEIVLGNLLHQFMRIVMENAGAQRGFFVVKPVKQALVHQPDEWRIEVEGRVDRRGITILHPPSGAGGDRLPRSLLNYVMRTRNPIVLDQAWEEPQFAADSYILTHRPKSILCFPVVYHGNLNGILYLENNLTIGAFTADRLEVLKLLMAQIAISMENALLYSNLQTYSQELESKSQELKNKNEALQASELRLRDKADELQRSLIKLKQTQAQLVQTEKISSLGQLVAGVAHEVHNPLGFISASLQYVQDYSQNLIDLLGLYQTHLHRPSAKIQAKIEEIDLDYLLDDLPRILTSMQLGTQRIREIMSSLRVFSRKDTDQKQPADIHQSLESTLLILQHRLKASADRPAIQLVKRYGELPLVECHAGQLSQVFMNLLANAIDALDDHSRNHTYAELEQQPNVIMLQTEAIEPQVVIRIIDNGPGIPLEHQAQLFQAFFTTKMAGKGTGLGLSISHQIVTENHQGRITCISAPGQGAEFVIELPIRPHS